MRGSAPAVHLALQQFERGRFEADEFHPYSHAKQRITNFSRNRTLRIAPCGKLRAVLMNVPFVLTSGEPTNVRSELPS
jgi:hypothetical protein